MVRRGSLDRVVVVPMSDANHRARAERASAKAGRRIRAFGRMSMPGADGSSTSPCPSRMLALISSTGPAPDGDVPTSDEACRSRRDGETASAEPAPPSRPRRAAVPIRRAPQGVSGRLPGPLDGRCRQLASAAAVGRGSGAVEIGRIRPHFPFFVVAVPLTNVALLQAPSHHLAGAPVGPAERQGPSGARPREAAPLIGGRRDPPAPDDQAPPDRGSGAMGGLGQHGFAVPASAKKTTDERGRRTA